PRMKAIRRPQTLAARLASFAWRLRALVEADLANADDARLALLYKQARAEVTPVLTHEDFADLLVQVLIYAFLLVRYSSQESADAFAQMLHAFLALPGLPPFVRALLLALWQESVADTDSLANCVRDLTVFLTETDIPALLEKLRPLCLQGDPL